jgi:chorismate synthase
MTGPKGAGKSSTGQAVAQRLGLRAIETDELIENLYAEGEGTRLSCREIYRKLGAQAFRELECRAVALAATEDWCVILTGGKTLLNPESRRKLRQNSILVFLTSTPELLWERGTAKGIAPFYQGPDGPELFRQHLATIDEVILPVADLVIDAGSGSPETLAETIVEQLGEELAVRSTSANTFGETIRLTTFGESHGAAVGAILDGVQPGVPITVEEIQRELDRRRPGQSAAATPRREADAIHILSGVFEGKTTGTPIALVAYNQDQKSGHYDNLRQLFRPGHADFAFYRKYGHRDHRGGGRSSGRETLARVAGGTFARKILAGRGVSIVAHAVEIAGVAAQTCDFATIESNPVRCADPEAAERMMAALLEAKQAGDSVGGIVQLDISGLPAGLGDPVFGKLSTRLTQALMSIGAVKGLEIGDGFQMARQRGSQTNDGIEPSGFLSNHAGGICGGISTGQPVRIRLAFKPTPSISKPQQTVDLDNGSCEISIAGRHDPCIVPRAIPVVEHMAALVLLDAWEIQERLRPGWADER